jgi:hypothetical protein
LALLSFEPKGRHKEMLIDWNKTEMPLGFSTINEPELQKVMALARKYGLAQE